jgi:hypothetical protein
VPLSKPSVALIDGVRHHWAPRLRPSSLPNSLAGPVPPSTVTPRTGPLRLYDSTQHSIASSSAPEITAIFHHQKPSPLPLSGASVPPDSVAADEPLTIRAKSSVQSSPFHSQRTHSLKRLRPHASFSRFALLTPLSPLRFQLQNQGRWHLLPLLQVPRRRVQPVVLPQAKPYQSWLRHFPATRFVNSVAAKIAGHSLRMCIIRRG